MKKLSIIYTVLIQIWASILGQNNKQNKRGFCRRALFAGNFLLIALFLTGCQTQSVSTPSTPSAPSVQEDLQKQNPPESKVVAKEAFKTDAGSLAAKVLATHGLRVYSTTCEWIADDRPYLLIGAMPEEGQSELLYNTAGVSVLFQKLCEDLQAMATKGNLNLNHVILVTPTFRVESRNNAGVNSIIYPDHEGAIMFRSVGDLQTDNPLNGFVGATTIAKTWREVLKVNHAITDEKKIVCDIIVRQSGVPYCAFKDLLFTLDGKEGYLSSGGKLLKISDFQEVKEVKKDRSMRVLLSDSSRGYALIQSTNDGVMTLTNLTTAVSKTINLYVVNALYEIKSARLIHNDGVNWIVFEGADVLKKPYIIVMPILTKGKSVIYECSYNRYDALKAVNESQDKSERSIKTWIKKGWLLKMPDQIDVERSQ